MNDVKNNIKKLSYEERQNLFVWLHNYQTNELTKKLNKKFKK